MSDTKKPKLTPQELVQYFARTVGRLYSNNLTPKQKKALLMALKGKYAGCMACPLATQGRTQVVFGTGNENAQLMFVGEGPGKDEDASGEPFVGRAGQLLTKIIEAMGYSRADVYISNAVKCRPPENRTPLPDERDICTSLTLLHEIAIIKPKVICTLGATATQALLGADATLKDVRGSLITHDNLSIMATYHPAYLLRNPEAKKIVWADMQVIMKFLTDQKPGEE